MVLLLPPVAPPTLRRVALRNRRRAFASGQAVARYPDLAAGQVPVTDDVGSLATLVLG
jgi:hypothetical protein